MRIIQCIFLYLTYNIRFSHLMGLREDNRCLFWNCVQDVECNYTAKWYMWILLPKIKSQRISRTGIARSVQRLVYRLEKQGIGCDYRLCRRRTSRLQAIQTTSGVHTASCLIGNGFLFSAMKSRTCEDGYSHLSDDEMKNYSHLGLRFHDSLWLFTYNFCNISVWL